MTTGGPLVGVASAALYKYFAQNFYLKKLKKKKKIFINNNVFCFIKKILADFFYHSALWQQIQNCPDLSAAPCTLKELNNGMGHTKNTIKINDAF